MTVTGGELVPAFECISVARRHLVPDISKQAEYQSSGGRFYELDLPVIPAANCPLLGAASLTSTKAEETTQKGLTINPSKPKRSAPLVTSSRSIVEQQRHILGAESVIASSVP